MLTEAGRAARDDAPRAADDRDISTGFGAYLFAHGAWFLAFGVQMVLFPYLVRVVLHESDIRFGIAQMSVQLPTTALILIGGFVADRVDTKRTVVLALLGAVAAFLTLGALVVSGRLTYGLLIGYALVVGTIGAFATPARDSLLSRVAPREAGIHKAVAIVSMAQFGGQIVGMILAALAPLLGVGSLLLGQAGLMAAAAIAALRMRPRPADAGAPRGEHGLVRFVISEIGGGLSAAARSPVIGPVLICSFGMGVCFMGAFAVLLPLIVQTHFPAHLAAAAQVGVASALGVFALCFWVGTTVSATLLMRLGVVRRRGVVYLAALASGACVLALCALPVPLWLLCAFNFAWGLCGGVAMTIGRGLVQEYAPEDKRARVLSIFTLGLMGGAPLGAVGYGFIAHAIGPRAALIIPVLGMLTVVALVASGSRLRHLETIAHPAAPAA